MPARPLPDTAASPAYMTVAAHVRQLGMSRGRFYELVSEGFFLPPIFLTASRRPTYTRVMAERNLLAMTIGLGVNGQPKVFNRTRRANGERADTGHRPSRQQNDRQRHSNGQLGQLVASLRSLGIDGASDEQVGQAVAELFPDGMSDLAEGDVIRAVYRHLRRSGTA